MAAGLLNPLRSLTALPADVLAGLRNLPSIARNTEAMAEHTANLDEVLAALQRVADNAESLPQMQEEMRSVSKMDERMAHIEGAMPVLVEVQQHLANVPEALGQLQTQMRELSELLESFLTHVDRLSDSVDRLEVAVGPLGRIADRLPGRSKGE
jgi:methyl-accepting chemotaxis protein